MRRKIFALLILSIFLISLIPATFAQIVKTAKLENINVAVKSTETQGIKTGLVNTGGREIKPVLAAERIQIAKKAVRAANGLEKIRAMSTNEIRVHQKEQLMKAVELCREKGLDSELCEKKFTKRIELITKLKETGLERLKRVEARKIERTREIKELAKDINLKKFSKNLEFKARVINKVKLEKARENFQVAIEKFQKAKGNYQEAQLRFKKVKEKVAECANIDSEECNIAKENIRERAREHLLHTADVILEHLNKIKSKVESNEDLSEEEAAEIIAKIDEEIAAIEDAKSTIESSEDKEDVIEAAKKLKRTWIRVKERAKEHVGRIVNARIGGIIVKSKHLEVKLERILTRMAEKGLDTSGVEPLVDEFNAKLDEAKTHYEMAVEKFKEAKAGDEPNAEIIKEAQSHMKQAKEALQDAQKILRDIVLAIKQAGGADELEETEEEVEIEEEIEESEEGETEEAEAETE